ncbi:MAG: hypothetical protein KA795_02620 [Burkholderiaceae bacterium]|nr:hypothetical protein [Burkholderiaceae bacterium]
MAPVHPSWEGRFNGREDFRALVRQALVQAAAQGWQRLMICDASFADWPLGERAVAESLQSWSRTGRSFVMLARSYDAVVRDHARFVTWRRQWSHIIDCRACGFADPLELPSAILSDNWALRRLDPVRSAGVAGSDAASRLALREALDEWWRRSSPAFPSTTLGL